MSNVKAIRSESLSKPYDYRYVIVDIETGEILDDAQGYGYKTAQKAYAGYNYKIMPKSEKAKKAARERHMQKWVSDHKAFERSVEDASFYALKDRVPFGFEDFKQMLLKYNIDLSSETFTDRQLYKYMFK